MCNDTDCCSNMETCEMFAWKISSQGVGFRYQPSQLFFLGGYYVLESNLEIISRII